MSERFESRRFQSRNETEKQNRGGRQPEREHQGDVIDTDFLDARQIRRRQGHDALHEDVSQEHAGAGRDARKHAAFRQKLPHQARASGTKSRPQRHLPRPIRGAREQQVGDVGAADEQGQRHRTHEHPERALDVPCQPFLQRDQRDVLEAVARILGGEAIADDPHLSLRRGERHAPLEPADRTVNLGVPVRAVRRSVRYPDVRGVGILKARRRDPDDLDRRAVQQKCLSHRCFGAAEVRHRPAVTHDRRNERRRTVCLSGGRALLRRRRVPGREETSGGRRQTEHRKEVRRHTSQVAEPAASVDGRGHLVLAVGVRHDLEDRTLSLPVQKVRSRDVRVRSPDVGPQRFDRHDAIGVGIAEWLEQNRVHDGEHGGVRADAKREHRACAERESPAPPKTSCRVTDVADELVESAPDPGVPHVLLHLSHSAELHGGASPGVHFGEPGLHQILNATLDVVRKLAVQVLLHALSRRAERMAADHGYRPSSKISCTALVRRLQLAFSTASCRRPAVVSV